MPTPLDQSSRPIELQTPLGDGVLGLRSIVVREQLGRLFSIEAELVSHDAEIKFDDIVGHPVAVRLTLPSGTNRYWHGVVARFQFVGSDDRFCYYRALIMPWLWAFTRSADCRIFQEMTVPDIVQKVFRDRGASDFQSNLSGSYPTAEYCVQYRETDFNFVSRLLEREGIAYYHKHTKEKGVLVLADEKASYEAAEGYAEVLYRPGGGDEAQQEGVKSWLVEHEVQPTQYALSDYNPLRPAESLLRTAQISRGHAINDRQMFDYPGAFADGAGSERVSRIRLEELHVGAEVVRASGTVLGLGVGNLFKLKDHPRADQGAEHLVTTLTLQYDAGEFETSDQVPPRYACEFTAIPSAHAFRPARTTPRPVVHGPQSAIVVGASGEEIHTDEHGRVKVHFYWDREGKADDTASCWVRVAQGWAGKKWGSFFLPRVGHEVLVEFLEGDPDRPIITGSVFHGENKPPYPLPAEKTKSTLKSLSSKDGGGFNEFRFEDKKGSEEVFLHAEKDLVSVTKANSTETVGGERRAVVEAKVTAHYKAEHHVHVVGNELAKFDADRNTTITGNRHDKIDGADHLTVGGDRMVKVDGADNLTVGGDLGVKTTGKATLDAGGDVHQKSGGGFAVDAGTVHIKAGQTLILEAGSQLSLKVGGNFVDIGPSGVNIVGTLVGVNSGGSAGSGGGCSPLSPAAPDAPDAPADPEAPPEVAAGETTAAAASPETATAAALSPAAFVLAQAAAAGTPFCEECERAAESETEAVDAEEVAVIESIVLVDGEATCAGGNQIVNLPHEAAWVDTANGIPTLDRLGPKLKFKVTFNRPGAHAFTVRMEPGTDNIAPSDAEKGRNAKFKYQDETKNYTTDGDGTKTVAEDFFTSCCGLDTFKLVAEDTTNHVEVESPVVTVRRIVYYQPIVMAGSAAPDFSVWRTEFARNAIDLVGLTAAEVTAMENIGSDAESNTYQSRVNTAFNGSPGNAKRPHCVALGITGYLAVKNANQRMPETAADASGAGAGLVRVPVRATNLVGGGIGSKSLWHSISGAESWFVSGEFLKADGSTVPITEDMCTPVATASNSDDFRWIDVDAALLPEGGGTIKLRVNVVDRWRNGLSFGGGNVICIAAKVLWRDRAADEMNQTLIHEMGHKVNMVCDGTGSSPDAPAERYTERGHVGPHCYHGLALVDDFRTVSSGAGCVMFGASVTGRPNEFCENCTPAVRKMDISAGF